MNEQDNHRPFRRPDLLLFLLLAVLAAGLIATQVRLARTEALLSRLTAKTAGVSNTTVSSSANALSSSNQAPGCSADNTAYDTAGAAAGTASGNTAIAATAAGSSPFTKAVSQVRGSVVGITIYTNTDVELQHSDSSRQDNVTVSEEVVAGEASGVVIADGKVLTCYHVVKDAARIAVTTGADTASDTDFSLDGETELDAEVADYDEVLDLAVLTVSGLDRKPVPLGDSGTLAEGDWAICIGSPASHKLAASVSVGVISGLNRTIASANVKTATVQMFQTDAAINGGSSGGGIFNTDGELVGIVARKYISSGASDTQLEGIGMCIPINDAKPLLANAGIQ